MTKPLKTTYFLSFYLIVNFIVNSCNNYDETIILFVLMNC